ncbi:MAG: hypothetical protein ABIW94_10205 [Gemmatimonadaceae bacterium]
MATRTGKKKALVPQPHGGALLKGGNDGNRGGRGAVPSLLRERLVGSFEQRIPVLERIADGVPIVRVEIPLSELVGHVSCPKCGKAFMPDNPKDLATVTVEAKQSARPSDQIRAVDTIGKYGPGEKHEITMVSAEVKDRLRQTVDLINSRASWESGSLLGAMEGVWR